MSVTHVRPSIYLPTYLPVLAAGFEVGLYVFVGWRFAALVGASDRAAGAFLGLMLVLDLGCDKRAAALMTAAHLPPPTTQKPHHNKSTSAQVRAPLFPPLPCTLNLPAFPRRPLAHGGPGP